MVSVENLTSSKPRKTAIAAHERNVALIKFGGAYGNFSRNQLPPKISGKFPAGSDVIPPIIGPIMLPIFATIGKIKNALDWNFFSLTISLIIVLITPTLPFKAPPNIRHIKAW